MSPRAAATDEAREELIDGAYRQGQGGTLMNLMAIAGIAWLHWLMTRELLSPSWLGGMLLLSLLRGAIILKVCADPSAYSINIKERLFVVPLVATSLLWGVLPLLVFPTVVDDERLALSVVHAAMAGGAASVLAALKWTARFYLVCMLGPASILLAFQEPYGIALTALGFAYLGVILLVHTQAHRMLVDAQLRLHQNHRLSIAAEAQRALVEQLNQDLLAAQNKLWDQNSELEKLVAERTEKMRLSAVAIENTAEGVMVLDHAGTILEVNPGFTRITGFAPDDVIGREAAILNSPHQDDGFYDQMSRQLVNTGRWEGELWSRTVDGVFLERRSVDAVRDTAGRITHYVSVFNDITELRQKDDRIRRLAYHDTLTGLPNRLLLEDRLCHGIAVAQRRQEKLAVMFLDLDRFKSVKHGLGHDIGDLLLQQVADRIRTRMHSSDTLGRLGGDEFLILQCGVQGNESCTALARKISAALTEPIQVLSHRIHIGVSIGIAVYPEDGTDSSTLMKNADTAMYAAKNAGRGTVRYFQPEMSVRASQRLELELRQAIERRELSLHYQPKVASANGAVKGYEALLRWRNPQKGMIPPGQFIPLAEDGGLISRIGEWILGEACRQIADWEALGLGWQRVAVNVSARQLRANDLVRQVREAIARAAIPPGLLEIELTESVLISSPQDAVRTLVALKELGVTLAIDDFGTGYSSLSYLRRLPIDVLKIDRSFVTESELDANGLAIVKTILALGRVLGLIVVAEGVETQAQALLLRNLGCHQLQGYYFSVPLPADQIAIGLRAALATA